MEVFFIKKYSKRLVAFLTIVMVLCCSFAVPASAAAYGVCEPSSCEEDKILVSHNNIFTFIDCVGACVQTYFLPVGTYEFDTHWSESWLDFEDPAYCVSWIPNSDDAYVVEVSIELCDSYDRFVVTADMADHTDESGNKFAEILVNSFSDEHSIMVRRVPSSVLETITGVWSDVLGWFGGAFAALSSIFYNAETGLTFIGYLSIGGVAVALGLLFLNLVKSWLPFGK